MLFALLYAVLRRVIGSGHPSGDREPEIEVVVLRHQVKVLSRKVGRPKLRRIDKAFLAACSPCCRGIAGDPSSWRPPPCCVGTENSCGGNGRTSGNAAAARPSTRYSRRSSAA